MTRVAWFHPSFDAMKINWYEVWSCESLDVPYILVLISFSNGEHRVVDPAEKYRVVFTSSSYQEAVDWLCEDEFTAVGRKTPDGW